MKVFEGIFEKCWISCGKWFIGVKNIYFEHLFEDDTKESYR